jgi:membrane protease YdiL (CAAX protease family)
VPLGYIGATMDFPMGLLSSKSEGLLIPLTLLLCGGVVMEILFRGLLHRALRRPLGVWALPSSTLVYAVPYLASLSPLHAVFAAAHGTLFAWGVDRTDSLAGVCLAHGLMTTTIFLAG